MSGDGGGSQSGRRDQFFSQGERRDKTKRNETKQIREMEYSRHGEEYKSHKQRKGRRRHTSSFQRKDGREKEEGKEKENESGSGAPETDDSSPFPTRRPAGGRGSLSLV
ncbi:hypothetical protein P170DRAFT_436786 [Aspergillus steynii IBT 23096]|uniref:Uncharacterized protein n=1 Tax=Aspergillus steynii IBT 23096 TaxID=1392250 RepID=A0A2I2G8F6_9EURO|nr:uncharacterized protein P170DRAFT_436786 [Aspergillus steynii IBT 23096]PLB49162.1 hypothetical protein P170DRAFT_436786 [Aspergillus steynii IBT 23096]